MGANAKRIDLVLLLIQRPNRVLIYIVTGHNNRLRQPLELETENKVASLSWHNAKNTRNTD